MRRVTIPSLLVTGIMACICYGAEPAVDPADFSYWLEASDGSTEATVAPGGTVEITALLSSQNHDLQGWSFGIAHDSSVVKAVDTGKEAMLEGTGTNTVNNGSAPDFVEVKVFPESGVTYGVVISFASAAVLEPTERFTIMNVTYEAAGDPEDTAALEFTNEVGDPPVSSVVVVEGQSYAPGTMDGATIEIKSGPPIAPMFSSTAVDSEILADKSDTGDVKVEIGLAEDSAPADIQGWSYGISHDNSELELVDIVSSDTVNGLNGGEGPDFVGYNTAPAGGAGGVVGVAISLEPEFEVIPVAAGEMLHTETFVYKSAVELSEEDGDTPIEAGLSMAHEILGDPPAASVISVDEDSFAMTEKEAATITLKPVPPVGVLREFIRGDANNDGIINIADGVWILSYKFREGPAPVCLDAADTNDDGKIDQSDAILVIYYRLMGGDAPAAPFPECGTDPSDTDSDNPEDGLTCLQTGAGCQ